MIRKGLNLFIALGVLISAFALPLGVSAQTRGPLGPEKFPEGVSPLTGLEVADPDLLDVPPVMVSITNFPVSARPQAGLSYSSFVYEIYISEGMTRYLATFYGDFPQPKEGVDGTNADGKFNQDTAIGPIRSGRLPYESLRQMMSGSLVMASADPRVKTGLSAFSNTFGSDSDNINSAMIDATKLQQVASANNKRLKDGQLGGLVFDPQAPKGGVDGHQLWLAYAFLNQIIWRYNEDDGSYHRFQDQADAKTFVELTDRLTDEPLTYENVIVLFADHQVTKPTIIDISLLGIKKSPALLFRNGKMYKIFWTTLNGDFEKKTGLRRPMRFIDEQGNPVALNPGQTWVEIVPSYSPYYETVDSENYIEMAKKKTPGSGIWAVRFYAPAGSK
jgi:hypothetical protein